MNSFLVKTQLAIQLGVFLFLFIGNAVENYAQCGFQPISLYINGIEKEVAAHYNLHGPSEIILRLTNESEIQNCSYKFGKVQIAGNGGFNKHYSYIVDSPDSFSFEGATAKVMIDSKFYQELKNQKKIHLLHLTILEVYQKDESGNISKWTRWDDRNYQFTLN